LTGWRIDIRSEAQVARAELMKIAEPKPEIVSEEAEPVAIERDSLAPPVDEDAISIGGPSSASHNGFVEEEEPAGRHAEMELPEDRVYSEERGEEAPNLAVTEETGAP
jgi:hypothetical protein